MVSPEPGSTAVHARYRWLDQARGLVVLLYMVSAITSPLDGDVLRGEHQIGPTYLNHGYAYFYDHPAMITIIDVGQPIFMFVVGFAAYIAFTGRLRKRGAAFAWLYALRRVALLYLLSYISAGPLYHLAGQPTNWPEVLYDGILSRIAIGAFVTYASIYFLRNADRRIYVGIFIFIVHAFLFGSYAVDRYPWLDDLLGRPKFPLGALNQAGVAVFGSVFAQWALRNPQDVAAGFRNKVVPASVLAVVLAYCMEWLQPSEHHDVTTALALLSVGLSGLLVAVTYAFGEQGIEIPMLRALGKNLLLLFVLVSQLFERYIGLIPDWVAQDFPYVTLIFIGVLPMALMMALAVLLERRNIIIRV